MHPPILKGSGVHARDACVPALHPAYSLLGFRATPQPPFKGGFCVGCGALTRPILIHRLVMFVTFAHQSTRAEA